MYYGDANLSVIYLKMTETREQGTSHTSVFSKSIGGLSLFICLGENICRFAYDFFSFFRCIYILVVAGWLKDLYLGRQSMEI